MDIRQLRYFVKVAQLQSFSRAARELGIAQPSLSIHVKNLEHELGGVLLIRTTQGVRTTALGERLIADAEPLIRQLERISALAHGDAPAGRVTVGFASSTAAFLLIPLVREIQQRYPAISLAVYEDMSSRLLQMIGEETLDMAVVYSSHGIAGLRSELIAVAGMELLCPPPLGPLDANGMTLRDAFGFELILPDRTHHLRQMLEKLAQSEKLHLKVAHECQSVSSIIRMVEGGFGATILSSGVGAGFPNLLSAPLHHSNIHNEIRLVYDEDRTLTNGQDAVRRSIADLARTLYPSETTAHKLRR